MSLGKQLSVKNLAGRTYTLYGIYPNTTVRELKQKIYEQDPSMPPENQKIISFNRALEDTDINGSNGIIWSDSIHVIPKESTIKKRDIELPIVAGSTVPSERPTNMILLADLQGIADSLVDTNPIQSRDMKEIIRLLKENLGILS